MTFSLYARGTFLIFPSLRTLPPKNNPCAAVFAVPLLALEPIGCQPILRSVASGHSSFKYFARQSVGITSDPTPGQRTMPADTASLSHWFA